ncbi:hypothetical protein MMC20_002798 [Loxospora ochrophaea]|nr:hypothetical protein [Loxospora ochrophaea]
MGARVLAMATVAPPEKMEPKQPFQYLSNVTRILPDLLTQRPSLLGAQALIGIAAFMQTTDTPAPSFPLLAAAMRQIQQLNFDDADFGDFSGKHFEQRQARRCFWLAFSLDNDITLQFGTALPHSDAELEKGLSCEDYDEDDLMLLPDEQTTHVNVFRARVKLVLNTALTAFSILFTHTFQNPGNPNAESDLELMHTVVEIITVFEQSDANINCMPELLIICQELEKIAINAVARQHPEQLLPEFTEMEFPQDLLQDLFDVSYSMQGADSQATDGALPSTHSAFYPPSNSALNPQWTHSDFSTALGLDNSTT